MPVPHPIPYQGSKRNLAPKILDYLPADTMRVIEPFAGSAALSLAAAASNKANAFYLNDINAPLITLWHSIINTPETLARHYRCLWQLQSGQERAFYDRVRDRFNRTHRPHYFLYLLARCVKAAVRYNADGEFNQSPDNRRKGRKPAAMRRDILGASALLQNQTKLTAYDYRDVLAKVEPGDVVYLDPPYQGVCAARDPRYVQGVTYAAFVNALVDLNRRHIAYIVSYDGRTGDKAFGQPLPRSLNLRHIELDAGRSSQATLLGRTTRTFESLYLSHTLCERLAAILPVCIRHRTG